MHTHHGMLDYTIVHKDFHRVIEKERKCQRKIKKTKEIIVSFFIIVLLVKNQTNIYRYLSKHQHMHIYNKIYFQGSLNCIYVMKHVMCFVHNE